MDSLSVSASNTSSCPNHCKGLVEIKGRGRERQSRLLLPLGMSVCVHMCSINSQWGQNQDLNGKKEWNPKPCNPSKTCLLFGVGHTVKELCATLSLGKEFKSEDSVLVHRAFTSTASGTPFSWQRLLSVICLLQLFLWEGPPSAAWQGRELSSQMFFLSLSHPV